MYKKSYSNNNSSKSNNLKKANVFYHRAGQIIEPVKMSWHYEHVDFNYHFHCQNYLRIYTAC
jgi:hypothetical protein